MKYSLVRVTVVSAVIFTQSNAVIPGHALISTGSGVKKLENILQGDRLVSMNMSMRDLSLDAVARNVVVTRRNSTIEIDLGGRKIKASPDQEFFDPNLESWIKAAHLTHENVLLDEDNIPVDILDVRRRRFMPLTAYAVTVHRNHNLFTDGVLSHNSGWGAFILGTLVGFAKDVVTDCAKETVRDATRDALFGSGAVEGNGRDGAGQAHRDARRSHAAQARMTREERNKIDEDLRKERVQEKRERRAERAQLAEADRKAGRDPADRKESSREREIDLGLKRQEQRDYEKYMSENNHWDHKNHKWEPNSYDRDPGTYVLSDEQLEKAKRGDPEYVQMQANLDNYLDQFGDGSRRHEVVQQRNDDRKNRRSRIRYA